MDIILYFLIFIIGLITGCFCYHIINSHAQREETEEYLSGLLEQIRKNQHDQKAEIKCIRRSLDNLEQEKLLKPFKSSGALDFPKDYRKIKHEEDYENGNF